MPAGETAWITPAAVRRTEGGNFFSAFQILRVRRYRWYPAKSSSPPSPERLTVTLCRASRETRKVGICDESAKGSSYMAGSSGTTSIASWGVT